MERIATEGQEEFAIPKNLMTLEYLKKHFQRNFKTSCKKIDPKETGTFTYRQMSGR